MTFRFHELEKYRTGGTDDEMELSIPLPRSPSGMVYLCCPKPECTPGLFQIGDDLPSQAIAENHSHIIRRSPGTAGVTCPYCGHDAPEKDFIYQEDVNAAVEQVKFAVMQDVESHFGKIARDFNRKMKRSGKGMITPSMDIKGPRMDRPIAIREDLLRDLTCEICQRRYGVYAIGLFCPDCGVRNLHVHFKREVKLVNQQIGLAKREEEEGRKELAYRLLGNAQEDVLTAFETYLKTVFRFLVKHRLPEEAEKLCSKQAIGNKFQNIKRGQKLFAKIGINPYDEFGEHDLIFLRLNIEKRHVLGHNLGIADETYAEVSQEEPPGQTVQLIAEEIIKFAEICSCVISNLEKRIPEFQPSSDTNKS